MPLLINITIYTYIHTVHTARVSVEAVWGWGGKDQRMVVPRVADASCVSGF